MIIAFAGVFVINSTILSCNLKIDSDSLRTAPQDAVLEEIFRENMDVFNDIVQMSDEDPGSY